MYVMKQFSLLFLFVITLASACSLDGDTPQGPVFNIRPTLEVINGIDDFSLLARALNRSGLDSALLRATPFTLFAPTDAAWDASGIDVETMDSTELSNLLRYHILLSGAIGRSNIQQGQVYLSTANIQSPDGSPVMMFLEGANNQITINNDAIIVAEQLVGNNAIIHPINLVLQPPTIMGLLEGNPELSTMAGLFNDAAPLADSTAVADSLRRAGPFTVFAPINNAIPGDRDFTPEEARSVALYHVVSTRNFRFGNFPSSFTTLQGDNVNVFGRDVVTSSAQSFDLQFENIQATNGTLHLISGLMLPEGL